MERRAGVKETLLRLIDHAKAIGAFDQITIIEEPSPHDEAMCPKHVS